MQTNNNIENSEISAPAPAQVARFTELQALVAGMAADFEKFYKDGNRS